VSGIGWGESWENEHNLDETKMFVFVLISSDREKERKNEYKSSLERQEPAENDNLSFFQGVKVIRLKIRQIIGIIRLEPYKSG